MTEFHNIWALEELHFHEGEGVRQMVMFEQNYEQYLLSLPDVCYRHRFAT